MILSQAILIAFVSPAHLYGKLPLKPTPPQERPKEYSNPALKEQLIKRSLICGH